MPAVVQNLTALATGLLPEAYPLSLEPLPRPRRVAVMTYEKLYKRIEQGMGIGHGSNYTPWLTIRRKNTSPSSGQVVSWMPPLKRDAHYFSVGEFHTALVLLWIGVQDLREQYPIWPVSHPHPLVGAADSETNSYPWAPGLATIADEANIRHGTEVGSDVLYVASIDLLATVPFEDGPRLATFSSKPFNSPEADVRWRTAERLELERRYSAAVNARYFISSSALVPPSVAANLEWWFDFSTLDLCPHLLPHVDEFAKILNESSDLGLNEVVPLAAQVCNIALQEGWLLFRHCAWHQFIDINPSITIRTSHPPPSGGRQLRQKWKDFLFGGEW
jgi:hypothetical protein